MLRLLVFGGLIVSLSRINDRMVASARLFVRGWWRPGHGVSRSKLVRLGWSGKAVLTGKRQEERGSLERLIRSADEILGPGRGEEGE